MFDFGRFLRENFSTPTEMLAFLRAYNAPVPSTFTVQKWFQRDTVPSDWFPILLAYLELDRGAPVRLMPYMNMSGGDNVAQYRQ